MSQPVDPAEFVKQAAALINLPLHPEHEPGVIENFARIAAVAQQINQVPLPESVDIAPIFQP